MRPLFVEFPHATVDEHPMDLDASDSEFLVGPDLLVAPNPSPEEIAPYEVHLPPGTWYDYWTGEQYNRATRTQSRDLEQREDPAPRQTPHDRAQTRSPPRLRPRRLHPPPRTPHPKHRRKILRSPDPPRLPRHRPQAPPAPARFTPTTATPSTSAKANYARIHLSPAAPPPTAPSP